MAHTELAPSLPILTPATHDAVFSPSTNNAVNRVISSIAEARQTLAQANSSSQGLIAWALDLARKITGTEHSAQVSEYANLVSLRTRAVAQISSSDTTNLVPLEMKKFGTNHSANDESSFELAKTKRLGPEASANDEVSFKKAA